MTVDKFPIVTTELINALRETFPITERTLEISQDEIQRMRGTYDLINYLEHVNDVQTNPDSEK